MFMLQAVVSVHGTVVKGNKAHLIVLVLLYN